MTVQNLMPIGAAVAIAGLIEFGSSAAVKSGNAVTIGVIAALMISGVLYAFHKIA